GRPDVSLSDSGHVCQLGCQVKLRENLAGRSLWSRKEVADIAAPQYWEALFMIPFAPTGPAHRDGSGNVGRDLPLEHGKDHFPVPRRCVLVVYVAIGQGVAVFGTRMDHKSIAHRVGFQEFL